ncbi:hypothetical protein PybrP1_011593, partial [[Pythium] brassicae (nom. inval.)]
MLSAQQTAAARNFFGRVQSGVSRLQSSVHQQLSYQLDVVSSSAAAVVAAAAAGANFPSTTQSFSGDVVVSSSGATLKSLFVTSDFMLSEVDGVSLTVASFLSARELFSLQLVNHAWRAFVATHRERLYGELLPSVFDTIVPSPSAFASFMLSYRFELMRELLHTRAIEPTFAALETYCTTTESANHGFIAMFCDIVEFTDPRVARFVAFKRHHALSVVLAATPAHVDAFRKRSGYTRPIAFVPVHNPHWPEFDLPQIHVPGFLGYANDFVRMAPGYESLRATVVKSILRDLMIFDTSAHAAAYGASIGRQPFAAVLDEAVANPALHMTFSSPLRRQLGALPIAERIRVLQERIEAVE